MQSDTTTETVPSPSGRRRKHAGPARLRPQEGPVFVDSSGRRAKLLRRAGAALSLAVVGYAAVLGLSFMGGISLSPSQLLPIGAGPAAGPGRVSAPPAPPAGSGAPSGPPTAAATTTAAEAR